MSDWKKVWNRNGENEDIKSLDFDQLNMKEGFIKLKEMMGITLVDGKSVSVDDFYNQFMENLREMSFSISESYMPKSFFDVGCGTGSYLFLLKRMFSELRLGGMDYSEGFIKSAIQAVGKQSELYTGEALDLDIQSKYDVVFSRSIFQYFDDDLYAKNVTEKMLEKANHAVAILDVHDLKLREDFLQYRRSKIEDYDRKYANTKHLFLPKELFLSIAEEHGCSIKFSHSSLPGYWNSKFTYDVYLFKNFGKTV